MNKRDAKKFADTFEGTFGDLLRIVDADTADNDQPSTLNKGMSHGQAKDILRRALLEKPKTDRVRIWVSDPYSRTGRMKRGRDALIVQNIMRECATKAALRALAGEEGQ